jgi:hypothetical protein
MSRRRTRRSLRPPRRAPHLRKVSAGAGALGALRIGALAAGAVSVGAGAVFALAIRSLAIRHLALRRGSIRDLAIQNLRVGRLEVGELVGIQQSHGSAVLGDGGAMAHQRPDETSERGR